MFVKHTKLMKLEFYKIFFIHGLASIMTVVRPPYFCISSLHLVCHNTQCVVTRFWVYSNIFSEI